MLAIAEHEIKVRRCDGGGAIENGQSYASVLLLLRRPAEGIGWLSWHQRRRERPHTQVRKDRRYFASHNYCTLSARRTSASGLGWGSARRQLQPDSSRTNLCRIGMPLASVVVVSPRDHCPATLGQRSVQQGSHWRGGRSSTGDVLDYRSYHVMRVEML